MGNLSLQQDSVDPSFLVSKRLAILAFILWLVSLGCTGLVFYREQVSGIDILMAGWLGPLALNVAWYAIHSFYLPSLSWLQAAKRQHGHRSLQYCSPRIAFDSGSCCSMRVVLQPICMAMGLALYCGWRLFSLCWLSKVSDYWKSRAVHWAFLPL